MLRSGAVRCDIPNCCWFAVVAEVMLLLLLLLLLSLH
jgi:hypothetical protein